MSELKMINNDLNEMQSIYKDITENGFIGGYHKLQKLSGICLELSKKNKDTTIPAFVLSTIFDEIADNQYERPVKEEECRKLYDKLNPLLQNVFEDISTGAPYVEDLNDLISTFNEIFYK